MSARRDPGSNMPAGAERAAAILPCGSIPFRTYRTGRFVRIGFMVILGIQFATESIGAQQSPADCIACAWSECVGCIAGPGNEISPACQQCDLTGDSHVDLLDVGAFLHAFGGTPGSAVCGNGVVETGEACDPPNGVTCDANCQILTGSGVPNDSCQSSIAISEGIRSFSNIDATTDGPDEPGQCVVLEYSQIGSDIWYCYTATATDTTVVSLCCSAFDTKMVVYPGCDCARRPLTACSDDDCGTGTTSRLTFAAAAGESYLIRIGGFEAEQGTGVMNIYGSQSSEFGVDSCGAGAGACFTDSDPQQGNGSPGCEDVDVCTTVCDLDPCCCDVEWDGLCAQKADGIVNGFDACGPGNGDCFNANGSAGCEDTDCCNDVCRIDPFCCLNDWDAKCLETVEPACGLFQVCETAVGNCFAQNATAGCDNQSCCDLVCAADSLCCSGTWDDLCVEKALELCR